MHIVQLNKAFVNHLLVFRVKSLQLNILVAGNLNININDFNEACASFLDSF